MPGIKRVLSSPDACAQAAPRLAPASRNAPDGGYRRRVPNPRFAFLLFLSSYSPAFLIIAIRSFQHSWTLFWVSIAMCVGSAVAFLIFLTVVRRGAPILVTVQSVEPRSSELAAYVATYLLPFVLVPSATLQDVLGLAVFIVFIGILWVNSGMLYLNPLLALCRFRLYVATVRASGGSDLPRSFLITRHVDLAVGEKMRLDRVMPGVLIDHRDDGAG
jgi:hypothetical protein